MTVNKLIEMLEEIDGKQMQVRFTTGALVEEVDVIKHDYPNEGFNYVEIG